MLLGRRSTHAPIIGTRRGGAVNGKATARALLTPLSLRVGKPLCKGCHLKSVLTLLPHPFHGNGCWCRGNGCRSEKPRHTQRIAHPARCALNRPGRCPIVVCMRRRARWRARPALPACWHGTAGRARHRECICVRLSRPLPRGRCAAEARPGQVLSDKSVWWKGAFIKARQS